MLAGSAVVHVLGLVFVAAASGRSCMGRAPPPQELMVTKLVRLGQPRDKKLLPRKQPPPPPPAAQAVALSTDAAPKTRAAKTVRVPTADAKDRASALARLSNALDRVRTVAEGSPDGVPEGEVSDVTRAILGNKYKTEVYRCMKANFSVEGLNPARVAGKRATVQLRVKLDGTLFDTRMSQSSGLPRLDQAVLASVRRCGKISPPPVELRRIVTQTGIVIHFSP